MNYAKSKPYDYRRPDDADDILDEIEDGDSGDGELMTDGGCSVGFFDETFPKPEDAYQRVWDFETPSQEVSTERFDANTVGFYALNGADAVELMPNSKSESVCVPATDTGEESRRPTDRNLQLLPIPAYTYC